jgi:hypothetical protein
VPQQNRVFLLGGIKYKKSTIRNQSIIQNNFSSPMGPQRGKMKKQHVLKKGWFFKTSQLKMVDLFIFDTP